MFTILKNDINNFKVTYQLSTRADDNVGRWQHSEVYRKGIIR